MEFTKDDAILALSLVLLCAYVVHYIIEGLKKTGKIDGKAGQVNEALSAGIGLGLFALRYLGAGEQTADIEQTAVMLAESVLLIIATATSAKVFHLLVDFIRGRFGPDPKPAI